MDAVKPGAKDWTIKEQIIRDPASGLALQFEVTPDGRPCLRIVGDALPSGNQEIAFNVDGRRRWSRVMLRGSCPANWVRPVR